MNFGKSIHQNFSVGEIILFVPVEHCAPVNSCFSKFLFQANKFQNGNRCGKEPLLHADYREWRQIHETSAHSPGLARRQVVVFRAEALREGSLSSHIVLSQTLHTFPALRVSRKVFSLANSTLITSLPSSLIPTCSIDNNLLSKFDQSTSLFATKHEVCQTPETMGIMTFRRLRNYKYTNEPLPGHPLIIGGIREHISPHSLKLMNTGPHTTLTNPGYKRQTEGGFFYNYWGKTMGKKPINLKFLYLNYVKLWFTIEF